MRAKLKLKQKALARLNKGHLWVYRGEIEENGEESWNGDIVELIKPDGKFFAQGFYSHHSKIAVRILSYSSEPLDRNYFKQLIQLAKKYRENLFIPQSAFRLINAEADQLPGLIADWYDGYLVIQSLIPGTDKMLPILIELFEEELAPKGIFARNDVSSRKLEGLPLENKLLRGAIPEGLIELKEGRIRYLVDLINGQKTGAYLDQRENHLALVPYAKGRVLDGFCYQGGFSLQLASNADEIIAVDSSKPSLDILSKNLALNQLEHKVRAIRANLFDWLEEQGESEQKFDLIVLDPPPFAPSKKAFGSARRGYKELNKRALRLLNNDGVLATYSCSYHFHLDDLLEVVWDALGELGLMAKILGVHIQAKDHPILVNLPESWYLKGVVLRLV